MPDSPAAPTPYEVLGVSASASTDELRRAYRRLLRETHPDTGGSAPRFHAVQAAWERIGTPSDREAYDRGRSSATSGYGEPASPGAQTFSAHSRGPATRAEQPSAVKARSYGHPGGREREHYTALLREWVGRGVEVPDPFDPALVRSAPREVRRWLAKAQAEEETARIVSALGIAYTIWNNVLSGRSGGDVDHLVLGPAGLFALTSADWGDTVRLRKGELIGAAIADGETPIGTLAKHAKSLQRALGVRFRALVIVVPDDALEAPAEVVERGRHAGSVVVRRSMLPQLLRTGFGDPGLGGYGDTFDVRTRVQNAVQFV